MQVGQGLRQALVVTHQTAAAGGPGEGALGHPSAFGRSIPKGPEPLGSGGRRGSSTKPRFASGSFTTSNWSHARGPRRPACRPCNPDRRKPDQRCHMAVNEPHAPIRCTECVEEPRFSRHPTIVHPSRGGHPLTGCSVHPWSGGEAGPAVPQRLDGDALDLPMQVPSLVCSSQGMAHGFAASGLASYHSRRTFIRQAPMEQNG